jgi:hypothetical protein
MQYATQNHSRSAVGRVDLTTVAGIDRAMDVAIGIGDREMVGKLFALRGEKISGKRGRPGASQTADLEAVNALLREEAPAAPGTRLRMMQDISSGCRKLSSELDRARIAGVLSCGERRSQPKRKCWCCGWTLDLEGECMGCDADN